jgi:hypothetical protein
VEGSYYGAILKYRHGNCVEAARKITINLGQDRRYHRKVRREHLRNTIHYFFRLRDYFSSLMGLKNDRITEKANVKLHYSLSHVRWVPCHHGMARPQVVDGGDGLQIWRVAANILNKQWLTADKGRSSSLVLGAGLTASRTKNNITRSIGPGRTSGGLL